MTAHYPFDGGRFADIQTLIGQHAVKSACGKRAPFVADAATRPIDCAAVREKIESIGELALLSREAGLVLEPATIDHMRQERQTLADAPAR